jgi:type 1 glutamine amidotransferase
MARLSLGCVALAVAACSSSGTTPSPATVSRHVLYVTDSEGFRHDALPLSVTVLQEIGPRLGAFDVTPTDTASIVTRDSLARYDAVVFFTTGELPMDPAQQAALLEFVRGGKGFAGIHSAADTFYNWPDYGRMLGAYFDGHPWHQRVTVRVEDRQHPATRAWPASFTIDDEIYQFRNWSRGDVHVLLSLDPASVDLGSPGVNRTDGDFALAWTRTEGRGRVFYTALGHEPSVWRDAAFQQHLAGGIRWAIGDQ